MDNLKPYKIFLVDDDDGDYLIFKSILGDSPEWRFDLTRVDNYRKASNISPRTIMMSLSLTTTWAERTELT